MGHLPNLQRYLGHTSEPLTPTQTLEKLWGGWVLWVAYVIMESPQSQLDLDLGLGLRGPDLGLGLDNSRDSREQGSRGHQWSSGQF